MDRNCLCEYELGRCRPSKINCLISRDEASVCQHVKSILSWSIYFASEHAKTIVAGARLFDLLWFHLCCLRLGPADKPDLFISEISAVLCPHDDAIRSELKQRKFSSWRGNPPWTTRPVRIEWDYQLHSVTTRRFNRLIQDAYRPIKWRLTTCEINVVTWLDMNYERNKNDLWCCNASVLHIDI